MEIAKSSNPSVRIGHIRVYMRKLYTESTTTYNVAVTATNLEAMKTSGPGGKATEAMWTFFID
jgi:hypothetical protein